MTLTATPDHRTLDAPSSSARLLAGIGRPGLPDLHQHLRVHGPLDLPNRRAHKAWGERLVLELRRSGLTGRGGAGFPTAEKVAAATRHWRRPVVVVNAMESEPASSKDWLLTAAAPHLVLDGAEVLARLVNAVSVALCVSEANPQGARCLALALDQRARAGQSSAAIEIHQPPERYVAGEESSLIHWLEGGPAIPLFRRNGPGSLTLGGRPVLVDNAETVSHLALIARHGARWFKTAGTPAGVPDTDAWGAAGTLLATVSGAVRAPGVFEVPVGLPLQSLLGHAGALQGAPGVLLGGYGGTFVPAHLLGTPLAPEPLRRLSDTLGVPASLGTGGVLVLSPEGCPMAEAALITRWMAAESAGQCGPCVFGLPALAEDLEVVAFGRASRNDVARLHHHLQVLPGRGACKHPDGVARMARSALAAFPRHLEEHLAFGPCSGARQPPVAQLPAHTARVRP